MPKYGKKAQEKVGKAMHEYKRGQLKSGSGQKVKNKQQAVAIGLSEAREEGGKVPSRASSSRRRTTTRGRARTSARRTSRSASRSTGRSRTSRSQSTSRSRTGGRSKSRSRSTR